MTRNTILKLYKDILRYGETLKFTDQKYFRTKIRHTFKQNKNLTDDEAISFQLQKGLKFLENKRVV